MALVGPGIIDGHTDVLPGILKQGGDPVQAFLQGRNGVGHVDLPRARAGGMRAAFFSVYGPPEPQPDTEGAARLDCARSRAARFTALLRRLETASAGALRMVEDTRDLQACLDSETLGAILHFEGLAAMGHDLGWLEEYYHRGLRSVGPVWSRDNQLGYTTTADTTEARRGLTDLGLRTVRECNRLGILVDVSHMNEAGFRDTAAITEAPLVATHSNAYALSPHCRNLRDWQLDAIRDSGGLAGVTFCVAFLRQDLGTSAETPMAEVVRHVEAMVGKIGIDHVAFGSDFDGARIPREIGDASGYARLIEALRLHGFDDASITKVAHGNWMRVLRKTWKSRHGPAPGAGSVVDKAGGRGTLLPV